MSDDEEEPDDDRPRKHDHLVEPMYSGLGVGEDEQEFLHEVDPDAEEPGVLLRWIRSARQLMRRDRGVTPVDQIASKQERRPVSRSNSCSAKRSVMPAR